MKSKRIFLRTMGLISVIGLIAILFDACSFCVSSGSYVCRLLSTNPPKEITDSSSVKVLEAIDTLVVYQGTGCSKSSKSGTEDIVLVEESIDLPPYVTNATVFLNGWKLEYLDDDHHVGGIGAMIKNIRVEEKPELRTRVLKWDVSGGISDKNFDDSYSICYHYTVVAWNSATTGIIVDHDDGDCTSSKDSTSNVFGSDNSATTTALSAFQSFLYNPAFAGSEKVAILPRGFGVGFSGCDVDHHLLQFGYNLDHSDFFIRNGFYKKGEGSFNTNLGSVTGKYDSGFVSWETYCIFKDNDGRRNYDFGEIVSGIAGADVSLVDPPFAILPFEDDCDGGVGMAKAEEFTVNNLPFRFAIPMLTGWDMGYTCNDEHIRKIGVWIENWKYEFDPLRQSGTLSYRINSNFFDNSEDDSYYRREKVSILGIKLLPPVKVSSQRGADLVPVIPPGTSSNSFCRRDPQGNFLFVTIKNQGNQDAAASVTSVTFGNQVLRVDTPPIKIGEMAEIQFRIPGNCYDPDCEFSIKADSENQVNEMDDLNNIVSDACKPVIL